MALVVKNPPANAGDGRDAGSIPGLGRPPGEGTSNPLQYPCLENSIDRGAWWATVHRVTQSQTQLKRPSMHARMQSHCQCWRCMRRSIPGLGTSPGVGNGNPLQCPCLENSMDKEAWHTISLLF